MGRILEFIFVVTIGMGFIVIVFLVCSLLFSKPTVKDVSNENSDEYMRGYKDGVKDLSRSIIDKIESNDKSK